MPSTRLLLVEDDPDQAALMAEVLTMAGYVVTHAPDAEAAKASLAESAADVLVIDWDLPGMGGDALVTWARTAAPLAKTLLCSNHAMVVEAAMQCGADAGYRKGTSIFELPRIVAGLVPDDPCTAG